MATVYAKSCGGTNLPQDSDLRRLFRHKLFILLCLGMVEAAGVEPASETTVNREHSCFSAFVFVSSSTLRTGEDAATTSLIDLVIAVQTEQR